MKQILKKLGYRSPDEMERAILFRAQRNGYIFLLIALLIWSLYEAAYAGRGRLNPFPCLLLGVTLLIQTFSRLIMTHCAVRGDTDCSDTGPMAAILLLSCVILCVTAAVGMILAVRI